MQVGIVALNLIGTPLERPKTGEVQYVTNQAPPAADRHYATPAVQVGHNLNHSKNTQ